MHHRVGQAFAVVCTLLAPHIVKAQVAQPAVGQPAYAQPYTRPAHPQLAGQPAWTQMQMQPAHPHLAGQPAWTQMQMQPAYPGSAAQTAYLQAQAQRPYPQAHYRPGYAAQPYASASVPTPAAYGYTQYPAYGAANAGPYYGPAYAQGSQGGAIVSGPRAEAPAPLVKTKDNLHYVEMGIGAFVPTDAGNPAKVGLEANVWAIHGGWVPNSGLYLTLDASTGFDIGCMATRPTDGCKGHLRIHWIGVGPFFNTGTPMIVRDVSRSWDLMALTGAEVRLWKGMTAKATINWFVPSPWGVYDYEKQLAEARMSGAASSDTLTPSAASGLAASANPMDAVESILGHALKHPQVNLMAMWEF